MGTVKVKPWGEGQGDHVIIDEENYDPKVHKLIKGEKVTEPVAPVDPVDPVDPV
jgi:hypothetical protein